MHQPATAPLGLAAPGLAVLGLAALVAALLLMCVAPAARAAEQRVALSPANAEIRFSIGALGLFSIDGRFARFDGALRRDPQAPLATQVVMQVDTTSIEAQGGALEAARDADLLRTREFPTMTFRSTGVARDAAGALRLDGMLTLAGVSRPLSLAVRETPQGGFVANGTLQRRDYGLTAMRPFVSDRVALTVTVAPIR
jgi:polyisoprenoid-binding protein YceI